MVWFRSKICTAILDAAMVYLWKYFINKFRTLSKNVFFSSLSGKSRIYIFSNFYLRVCHEDHSLRFCITSNSVFTECLEFAWFHHCHDWVRIFSPFTFILYSFLREIIFYWKIHEKFFIFSVLWAQYCPFYKLRDSM